MSDDGELPESEGELVDSEDDVKVEEDNNANNYTMFAATQSKRRNDEPLNQDQSIDQIDADFDPYSDYNQKPKIKKEEYKSDEGESMSPGEVSPEHNHSVIPEKPQNPTNLWDIRNGQTQGNRENTRRSNKRNRHDREENNDFLSQLDEYNSFKDDGASSTKRRKSTRGGVHIKDKNRYHDFDAAPGKESSKKSKSRNAPQNAQNDESDVGSDFSSDGEGPAGFRSKYILSGGSDDSMDEGRVRHDMALSESCSNLTRLIEKSKIEIRRTLNQGSKDKRKSNRPKIVDGRKKSPARKERNNRNQRTQQKQGQPGKERPNNRNIKEKRKDKNAINPLGVNNLENLEKMAKKTEACKHFMAKTFLKDRLRADWVPDDSREIEALEAAGVALLPKPPQGIPLLKTPPPSLLCEPMSGKYLDFSGPREVMPLAGEDYPSLLDYRADINDNQAEMCANFVADRLIDQQHASEHEIEEETENTIEVPFDDMNQHPEEIGWVLGEWKRGGHEPLPETPKVKYDSGPQSPRIPKSSPKEEINDVWPDEKKKLGGWEGKLERHDSPYERNFSTPPLVDPRDHASARSSLERGSRDHDDRFETREWEKNSRDRDDRATARYGFDRFKSEPEYGYEPKQENYYSPKRNQTPIDDDQYGFDRRYDPPSRGRSRERTPPLSSNGGWSGPQRYEENAQEQPYYESQSYRARDPRLPDSEGHRRDSDRRYDFPDYHHDNQRTEDSSNDSHPHSNTSSHPQPGDVKISLRRESTSDEPKTETSLIADHLSSTLGDPRNRRNHQNEVLDLPIPDMIDYVDFRVTFTINGQPYIQPANDPMISDYPKLASMNLAPLSLPRLSVLNDPSSIASDPRDPRRRSQVSNTSSSLAEAPNAAHVTPTSTSSSASVLSPTSSKKKISLSDYLSKKTETSITQTQQDHKSALPILYGSGDL